MIAVAVQNKAAAVFHRAAEMDGQVAGLFGGLTAKTSILFTQGLPALIALVFVLAASRRSSRDLI